MSQEIGGESADGASSLDDSQQQRQYLDEQMMLSVHERARQPMIVTGTIIIVVGTIGNILALFILRRKALRIYTTAFLLSLLAISDTACLYLGLLSKVLSYVHRGHDVFRTSFIYSCQIHVFALYTVLHFTSWLLALVSVERFVSTWFPHRSSTLCTIRNAKIVAGILFLIIAGYNSHFFFTMALQDTRSAGNNQGIEAIGDAGDPAATTVSMPSLLMTAPGSDNASLAAAAGWMSGDGYIETEPPPQLGPECTEVEEYKAFHTDVWPVADLVLFCFGPFSVMLVSNTLIAWRILRMRQAGDIVVTSTSPSRRLSGMTTIMFACTLTFFALTFPINIYILVRRQYPNEMHTISNPTVAVVWPMVNSLQYLNNACNFFLYCLTGSMFRRELRRFFVDWVMKLQALIAVLSATISEEKANRAAAAQSNGHLVLIEIGRNDATSEAPRGSRGILQRLINRSTLVQTTRTSMQMTAETHALGAGNGGEGRAEDELGGAAESRQQQFRQAGPRVTFASGADEPLLNGNSQYDDGQTLAQIPEQINTGLQQSNAPAVRVKTGRKMSSRFKMLRPVSSGILAAVRRYRFDMSDSEATSGCYQSAAEFAPSLISAANEDSLTAQVSIIGNDNTNNNNHISNNNTATGSNNDNIKTNDNNSTTTSSKPPTSNGSANASSRHQMHSSFRFHRGMTQEEKLLLAEFGPHC